MDWAAIATAVIAAAAVIYTARNARKTKEDEVAAQAAIALRPDWSSFAETLERRVEKQDRKIEELFKLVGQLRSEVEVEQRRSSIVLQYLRVVLAWAIPLVPEGTLPPHPPSEISDEISEWIGG